MRTKLFILLLSFLLLNSFQPARAEYMADVEVFDIEQEQVVKRFANTSEIQDEMKKYLETIDRSVPPLETVPKKGKMVRVPLQPALKVENQWIRSLVYEAFFIVLPDHEPFIILYDENRKPYLLQSKHLPKTLMNSIVE